MVRSVLTIGMRVVAFLMLLTTLDVQTSANEGPKFKSYPAEIYKGRSAKPSLKTPEARQYRTRLIEGSKSKPNFAGHYVLVTWGCGALCQTGAAIDAKTGSVTFLPVTVCCWSEDSAPFYYRVDSRLIVFGGQLNEDGPQGPHYYLFDRGSFVPMPQKTGGLLTQFFGQGTTNEKIEPTPPLATNDANQAESPNTPPQTPDVSGSVFDEHGQFTSAGRDWMFSQMRASLIAAVQDSAYLDNPFPEQFMSSGYFRKAGDFVLYANPTFGMVVYVRIDTATKRPSSFTALGISELSNVVGMALDNDESDAITGRFIGLNKLINKSIELINTDAPGFATRLSAAVNDRQIDENRYLISGPIMRSQDEDVAACFKQFNEPHYSSVVSEAFRQQTGKVTDTDFFAVDLMPAPANEGVVVMTDKRSHLAYGIVPLKRSGNECSFGTPLLALQDWN